MPIGEGWFIDRQTGEAISIYEHAMAVHEEPERYRVTADEVQGRSRPEVLKLVFQRGFIRVRWDKDGVVFEFHGEHEQALEQIRAFLKAHGVAAYTVVGIHDLSGEMRSLEGCWKDLEERMSESRSTAAVQTALQTDKRPERRRFQSSVSLAVSGLSVACSFRTNSRRGKPKEQIS